MDALCNGRISRDQFPLCNDLDVTLHKQRTPPSALGVAPVFSGTRRTPNMPTTECGSHAEIMSSLHRVRHCSDEKWL